MTRVSTRGRHVGDGTSTRSGGGRFVSPRLYWLRPPLIFRNWVADARTQRTGRRERRLGIVSAARSADMAARACRRAGWRAEAHGSLTRRRSPPRAGGGSGGVETNGTCALRAAAARHLRSVASEVGSALYWIPFLRFVRDRTASTGARDPVVPRGRGRLVPRVARATSISSSCDPGDFRPAQCRRRTGYNRRAETEPSERVREELIAIASQAVGESGATAATPSMYPCSAVGSQRAADRCSADVVPRPCRRRVVP